MRILPANRDNTIKIIKLNTNYYSGNRVKLLYMVEALHQRGFGKLKIIPSLSPSGMHWRCTFIADTPAISIIASTWLGDLEQVTPKTEITSTARELADKFVVDHADFMQHCQGAHEAYTIWFSKMVANLSENELPYAFSDYFLPTDFWQTSAGNKIPALQGDRSHYLE